uniref:Secreted protein n=1 Tax=Crocodylus porosus TaxID=8502 RepID=A0A7M4ECH5_CROPO
MEVFWHCHSVILVTWYVITLPSSAGKEHTKFMYFYEYESFCKQNFLFTLQGMHSVSSSEMSMFWQQLLTNTSLTCH